MCRCGVLLLSTFFTLGFGVLFCDDLFKNSLSFYSLTGNIPNRSSYGVFFGELVRYSRGCTYYKDFEDRAAGLITKLLRQAFTVRGLKAAFLKFTDYHILLAQKYVFRVLSLVNKIHSCLVLRFAFLYYVHFVHWPTTLLIRLQVTTHVQVVGRHAR